MDRLPPHLSCDHFEFDDYRAFLVEARERGYEPVMFRDVLQRTLEPDGRYLLLRHDVDIDPAFAVEMAALEHELGIPATYYFILSGAHYDILTPDNVAHVRRVVELGHDVGVHFDARDDVAHMAEVLGALAGVEVATFSQHNPTVLGKKAVDGTGLVDAYDPRIQQDLGFRYVSDSGMKWREYTFQQALERFDRLYVLAHPVSWCVDHDDLVQAIAEARDRNIERVRASYDRFIADNIAYHEKRKQEEGR